MNGLPRAHSGHAAHNRVNSINKKWLQEVRDYLALTLGVLVFGWPEALLLGCLLTFPRGSNDSTHSACSMPVIRYEQYQIGPLPHQPRPPAGCL